MKAHGMEGGKQYIEIGLVHSTNAQRRQIGRLGKEGPYYVRPGCFMKMVSSLVSDHMKHVDGAI